MRGLSIDLYPTSDPELDSIAPSLCVIRLIQSDFGRRHDEVMIDCFCHEDIEG